MHKSMKRILYFGLAALSIFSCSKSDSDSSIPSLSGLSITSATPPYVRVGDILQFDADVSSLAASDGTQPTIGLVWQVNSEKQDTLTKDISKSNPTFSYKVETLESFTVYCYAYAGSDYYSTNASTSFQSINPQTALTGLVDESTVTLEGNTYITLMAGGKTWLGNNLFKSGTGYSYLSAEVTDSVFGRYYTWTEATQACPAGWHLPTAAEFDACLGSVSASLMADAYFLGNKMWTYFPAVQITNQSGFNAIPTGYRDLLDSFSPHGSFGEYASWWTASETAEGLAEYRYIFQENPVVQKGQGDKNSLAMSVRCVQD